MTTVENRNHLFGGIGVNNRYISIIIENNTPKHDR